MTLNRLLFVSSLALLLPLAVQACGAGSDSQNTTTTTNPAGDGGLLGGGGGSGAGSGSGSGTSGTGGSGSTGTGNTDGGTGTDPSLTGDGGLGVPTFPGFVLPDGGVANCGVDTCPQCTNGIDDDGDGKLDGFDEECTGGADNDEGSFATGIPGDNSDPKWQDCFFDGNSGAGDDGCRYSTDCLTGDLDLSDPDCTLSQGCIDFCAPFVPNGCDCFGCCEVHDGAESIFVAINSGCDFDNIQDEASCPRCVQTTACVNTCGECELCPGKTIDDLPDNCVSEPPPGGDGDNTPPPGEDGGSNPPPPPVYTCDGGEPVCAAVGDCDVGFYCQFGCCVKSTIR